MFVIQPYGQSDFPSLVKFVADLQEHERRHERNLRPGKDIGEDYAHLILQNVAEKDGVMLFAQAPDHALGFICAWKESDDDPLLEPEARDHAYISDLFVIESCRGLGVAHQLIVAAEASMRIKGCRSVRVCAKASNSEALRFYALQGYGPYEIIYLKFLETG